MNICGNNNSYNRSSHFRQVAGLVMRLNRNWITLDEVKKELQDTFVKIDADAIINWINDNPGKPFPTDFAVSTIKVEASNSLLLKNNPFNGSISRYYGLFGGNAKKDAEDLQYKMNSTLVFELVYNPKTKTIIHANAPSAYYGYTEINRRLRKLKESFAKDVASRFNLKVPNYDFENDVEFTVFTNSIIRDALSALHTQNLVGHSIDKDTLDAFVKLAQFDELILNSNIVTLNPGEESNGIFSKNRYSFTGEPVYSRSMYEEHADVKDYTSKLVTCILDSVKCAESATGNDVDIKIGLDGFNHAIHYVNDYFSKLTILSEDKSKYSYAKRIELYLRNSGQLTKNLRQILYGLQKNIFNDNVPQEIVDLFSAQAETTVRSSYIEYGFDNIKIDATEKNIPGITYRKVHDRMEDQAKTNLASKLTSRMRYYQSLSQQERDVKRKNVAGFSILKKENGIIECVYNNDSNVRLSFTPIAKGYNIDKSNIRPEHNAIFAKLINELVDVSILNSKEVENELGSDQTLIDYFGQMLAVSCDALTGNFTKMMRQNKISFVSAFDFVSPAVGFMQRLTKNEIHTVTKDLHGHTIPSDQLVSFGYRIQELIDDIVKNKDHVQYDNLFITNRSTIRDISLRQSGEAGSVLRDVESMTFNEVEQLKVLYDFYQNLLKNNSVRLQPMTYSDKTRHLLYDVAVDKINIGGKNDFKKANELLKSLAKSFLFNGTKLNEDVMKAENLFIEQIKTVRSAQLEKSLISFVTRFSSALNMSVSGDLESQVNQIKERIIGQPISWLREKFKLKELNLYEENDIVINKEGNIIGINQATLDMYNIMTNTEHAKNYFNYMKYQYLKTLKDNGFKLSSVYDPSLNSLYFNKLDSDTAAKWINSQSGTMVLGFIKSKSGSILSEYDENDIITGNAIVELNPMFNSYFWAMDLFGEQLRSLTMGLDQNIAGGGLSFDDVTHNKFITHTKRAMGQGSTIMKFYPKTFGIAKDMDACVYDDVRAQTFNPKLDEKDELAFDGGGHISPFEFLMEQYSLPGNVNLRGDVMKSIVQYVDSNGALNQIKWAGTTLSNFRRRGCLYGNKLDLNVMFRKMHNRSISLNFKLDKYYGSNLFRSNDRIITCNEHLYFYDINSGKHYKILSVINDPLNDINTATRTVIEVDSHGNIVKNAQLDSQLISINNISDLHELFGGIYCKTLNQATKELEYSEINNEIVTNIICNQNLKNKFVAYAICKSAFKVGVHNINDSSIFSHANNSDLWTIKLDLSHSGMQLDAGHEVSDGHVSEGSQMISLVTEAGYATDIVQELYEQIAKVTDEGLSKFNDASKIKSVLSKILDESLNSGASDVVSITDDFIKHLKNKAKEFGIELELYFSSPSIRSKFSTAVCACINRLALRRKFAGLGTVQTPSYDQMVTHRMGNYNMTSEDLANEYRKSLNGNPISYLFVDPNSINSNVVSPEYIQNMLNIKSESDGISAIEQIEPYSGYVRNINFGDTIIYQDVVNGNFVAVNVEDIKTYDVLRHSQNVLYRWNTRPKNLIQQLSYFDVFDTITGSAYKITIYDFDEYRISAYLSEYLKNKSLKNYQLEFLKEKGISLDANLSEIINSQQKLLQKKLSEIGNAIKSGNSFALSDGIFITGHENVGAEIMIGNPWLKQFNLRPSDSLFKILKGGESFFESRLKEFYPKVNDVPKSGYDAVLYTSTGEPILIQFGSELQNSDRISNLRQGDSLTRIGNSILYDGEEMGSSIGFSDYEVQASGGKSYKVWRIADPSRLNNLLKKKMFDHAVYNMSAKTNLKQFLPLFYSKYIENGIVKVPIRIGNKIIYKDTRLDKNNIPSDVLNDIIVIFNRTQEDKFNSKLKDLAKQRAIAFKRLLTCIGTRIPSQALSSVAKCNIVGFTGSSSNDVYLPRVLTWVAGSDYDIDKFYIMMSEVLSNGTLPNLYLNNSNFDPIELSHIKKLIDKDQSEIEIGISDSFDPTAENVYQLGEYGVKSLLNGDHEILRDIVTAINNGKQIRILVNSNDIQLSPEADLINKMLGGNNFLIMDIINEQVRQNAWSVQNLINDFITSDPSKYAQKYREAAERNVVVDNLSRILSEPATQIALQSVVSADEGKRVADKMDEKYNTGSKKEFNFDNPGCITSQQIANMVGKIGIAATAVAKKAYDGISFSFNMTVLDIANNIKKNGYLSEEDSKKLRSIIIPTKEKSIMSIANINFDPLIESVKSASIGDVTITIVDGNNVIMHTLSDLLITLKNNCSKTNAVDYYSTMMTLATDNPKELLLARLNAVGENIDLYTYMFATGKTFEEAAEIMRSPLFSLVQKIMEKNLFQAGNERIRQKNAIDFLLGNAYLPTVNKYLLKDVMVGYIGINEYVNKSTLLARLADKYADDFINTFKINENITSVGACFENPEKLKTENRDELSAAEKWVLKILRTDEDARIMLKDMISEKSSADDSIFDEFDESFYDYDGDAYNQAFSSLLYQANFKQPLDVQKKMLCLHLDEMFSIFDELNSLQDKGYIIQTELNNLSDYTAKANEFATLGRKIFRINQGMPVGDYEEWNWSSTIENAINSEFLNATQLTTDPFGRIIKAPLKFIPFNWNRFLEDEIYADEMIRQYDYVKHTVNILQIVKNNKHMLAMLKGANTARKLVETSKVTKLIHDVAENIFSPEHTKTSFGKIDFNSEWSYTGKNRIQLIRNLSQQEYRGIVSAVNEHVIFGFFNHLSGFELNITTPMLGGYKIEKNLLQKSDSMSVTSIRLNTIDGMMNFKKWMDTVVFPTLRNNPSFSKLGNALQLGENYNKEWGFSKFEWTIDSEIANAKPGDPLYNKKADILQEFSMLARTKASDYLSITTDITIGDLLYLYNLMVHKDSRGLTFLFADLAASKNTSDWINRFEQYIKDIDYNKITTLSGGELFKVTPADVMFKVANSDNKWKFNLTKVEDVQKYWKSNNGVEYNINSNMFDTNAPFDIPSVYDLGFIEWTGFEVDLGRNINISDGEITHELIANLNSILMGSGITINEVDNSLLQKYAEEKSHMFENVSDAEAIRILGAKGFVFDGNVHINTDIMNSDRKVIIHELMHLVCANLHYNPKFANAYHKIINDLWWSASEDERSSFEHNYPNKKSSDLREEYFVEKIAELINNDFDEKLSSKLNGVKTIDQLKDDIFTSMRDIFSIDIDSYTSLESFLPRFTSTHLKDAIQLFKSGLFNFNANGFTSTTVNLSQELATLRNRLIDSGEIIEECK